MLPACVIEGVKDKLEAGWQQGGLGLAPVQERCGRAAECQPEQVLRRALLTHAHTCRPMLLRSLTCWLLADGRPRYVAAIVLPWVHLRRA